MWGLQGDLLNRELFSKVVVQGTICIDKNAMSLSILADHIHNFRCYIEFCSQVNVRVLSLVVILSTNQFVPQEVHQVTF